jgi:hypothetical protein
VSITSNFRQIQRELPDSVTIVLAAKTRTPEEVAEAIEAGATHIGENFVQEAERVQAALGDRARRVSWHMIGPLQKNKINRAMQLFQVIQTVDSVEKAIAIDKRARRQGTVIPVYMQINSADEAAKSGFPPRLEPLLNAAQQIAKLTGISVSGMMTMGPLTENPEDCRPYFRKTRELFDRLSDAEVPGIAMQTLSMGMSDSYRVAVEEGATMVRLGTVVFGARSY